MNIKKYFPQIGDKFGRWTLIDKTEEYWVCQCSCGKIKHKKKIYSLVRGDSVSCGCYKDEYYKTHNPMYNPEVRKRMSEIMKSKPNHIKKATIAAQSKEAKEKRKATNFKRYGGNSPACSPKIMEKIKITNLKKYGVNTPSKNPNIIKKVKKTCLKKYGTDNPMKLKKYKQLISKTIKDKKRKNGIYTLPSGVPLVDYCKENNILTSSARNILRQYGEKSLINWLNTYTGHRSGLEINFNEILKKENIGATPYNKQILDLSKNGHKYKPDIKIEGKDIYIDVDGLYIHATTKEKWYHFKKRDVFYKHKIKLFQFHEDEIKNNENIVISIIKNATGQSKKIGARSLDVVSIRNDIAQDFIQKNHLMGKISGVKNMALIDKKSGEVLSIILYKKYKNGIDISRFATKCGYLIAGGLSRLLKHIEKLEKPDFIQSFVDLRYSDGHSLESCGFKKEGVTLGWKWTDGKATFNRLKCRANMDERKLSEKEYAKEMKLYKLYDAGQAKFVKYFNNPPML